MKSTRDTDAPKDRYGPVTVGAAGVNIFVVNLTMWMFAPYSIFMYQFYLFILVNCGLAVLLVFQRGKVGQIGRGMLIGLLSVPVALVVFIPFIVIAQAIGPI